MDFCYLHPENEATGKCSNCNNWICSRDYNLLKKDIGIQKEVTGGRTFNNRFNGNRYKGRENKKIVTAPVIYCTRCYEFSIGVESEINPNKEEYNSNSKKVLMCNQCGEKLQDGDKYCPSCGDSTSDEIYDSKHPLKGVQASKRLK